MSRRWSDWILARWNRIGSRWQAILEAKRRRARRRSSPLPRIEPLEVRMLLSADPTLTVILNSATMSEFAAGNGVPAIVQRTNADLSQPLTVNLQSSDTTEATVQASIVIPAGASSASFLVRPVDDNILDGSQSLQITASAPGFVYASSTPAVVGLDQTFGSSGYATVPQSWSLSNVYPDLVIQPNGAIVSLSQSPGSSTSWSLARRNSNGTVDISFGGNGAVNTTFANATSVSPTALALQSDGKILAVGHAAGGVTVWSDLVVARYNSNGSLDTTFGAGGILRIERATHTNINDVSVLGNGSILLAGTEGNGGFLARITANGSLDTSFGTNGVVLSSPAGYSFAYFKSLNIQSDGKILVAGGGNAVGVNQSVFLAARFLPDGTLDTSYDFDGFQQIDTNPLAVSSGVLRSSVLQADGKLVMVGYDAPSSSANENWAIVRLNTDGSLDSSFSSDGTTVLDFNGLSDYANDVVIQSDGHILVMGEAFVSGNGYDLAVARFNVDGTLDTTFDGDGKIILPNWTATIWEQIWAGELNAEGNLVFLAGYNNDMRVGRINLNAMTPPRDTLTVTDFETLIVSIGPTSVSENAGPAAVTGTVTRGDIGDLSSPLTVSLQSSDTTELTVPATVVIPAGQSSTTFAINAVDDAITDGTQSVSILPSASGYISFSDSLSVTDDDTNVAPVASSQSRTGNEDSALDGQVSATDAEGDPLTYSVVTNPAHGQVTLNSNGVYVYTPALNFYGTDTFQFRAFDGRAFSNTATVSISVLSINDAPVAVDDTYTLNEDTVLNTSVVSQPVTSVQMTSDPGDYIGQGKTYNLSSGISAFAANNGSFVRVNYSNPNNSSDYWTIEFESPGAGVPLAVGTYSGATRYPFNPEGTPGLSVTGQGRGSNTLTGSFTINAIALSANGLLQSFSATFEQHSEGSTPALRGTVNYNYQAGGPAGVLVNDIDVDGNGLATSVVQAPLHGSVTMNPNGTFTYTPAANYHGSDFFTYVASDGALTSDPATVTLVVNSVEDAPSIVSQNFAIDENTPPTVSLGWVAASDGDAGQTLTYAITASTHPGAFTINAQTGELTLVDSSLLDHEQADRAIVTVTVTDDGIQPLSSSADMVITINDVNDGPIILTDSLSVNENAANGSVVGLIETLDQDANQTLTYTLIHDSTGAFALDSSTGELSVANGSYLNYEMSREGYILVSVFDSGSPSMSYIRQIAININDVNEAPTLFAQPMTVDENPFSQSFVGVVFATEPDANQAVTFAITGSTLPGAFTIDPTAGAILVDNAALLDYEAVQSVTLTVTATDTGSPAASSSIPVTISLVDKNEAPTMANQSFSINENSANGTVVGTVAAFDADAGQTLSYYLGGTSLEGAFAIDEATGDILVADSQLLNYEAVGSVTLFVAAVDNGNPNMWAVSQVTITIANVNDAPVLASQSFAVREYLNSGSVVGTMTATDEDAGQTVIYSIDSSSLPGVFMINPFTGEILVQDGNPLDYETVTNVTLSIRATDSGNPSKSTTASVSVAINDVNESPMMSDQSFPVAENSANGTVVGTVLATDVDAGQSLTYQIFSSPVPGAFAINAATGQITVANGSLLDFESRTSIELAILVTDNGIPALATFAPITINVTDVNEAPVVTSTSFSLNENSANGTAVGTVSASDPDAGQTRTFAITGGNTNNAFAINPTTGALTVNNSAALNFEATPTFSLTITATDNGTPAQSGSATVTVNLTNVNEAPVVTSTTFSLNENSANGTAVGTVSASDPDAGQTRTFAITAGNTNNAFAINPTTGALTVNNSAAINFEATPTFSLTITATDNGTPVKSGSATVTVNLTNVNEAPVVTSATFSLNENSANGTAVGTVSASDPDAGQTRTFAITAGNTNNAFAINPATGAVTVNNSAALNFEATQTFSLTITATDNGTPAQAGSATVTVNLINVNEAPVVTSTTFSLNENSANGTAVGTVSASDPDAGQTRTFAITAGNTNNAFAINPTTGALTVNNSAALNFEATPTFSLTITATDNGTPVKSGSATITVNLNNVNEAPVVTSATFSLNENSANGTAVGTVSASDPDAGQTRTFAITAGNTNNAFTINPTTGAVTVNNSAALNFETTPTFSLTITVTDNGTPVKSGSATVTINLTNVNEAPVISAQSMAVKTKAKVGAVVGTVTSSDPDAGQTRTYTIVSGNGSSNNYFSINSTTGVITVNNGNAVKSAGQFDLVVRVTDNGSPSLSSTGTVRIYVNSTGTVPSGGLAANSMDSTTTDAGLSYFAGDDDKKKST